MTDDDLTLLPSLSRLVPFGTLTERNRQAIQSRGRCVDLDQGRIAFRRGERDGSLHYLLRGSVDLADAMFMITSVSAESERARRALDDHQPHALTAVTTSKARLFVVAKDHVDLVLTWNQAGNYLVTELATGATDRYRKDWMSSLLGSAMFAAVPPANIQQLFSRFEELVHQAGEVVITEGQPGEHFYVVKAGLCRVTRKAAAGEELLAELGPGGMFGEDALIGDVPRNATVTMASAGVLMRLGKADFQALLQDPVLAFVDYATLCSRMCARQRPRTDSPMGLNAAVQILDVRLPEEYAVSRVPGSRNLPLPAIRDHLAGLDRDVEYVVTCDGGRRSALAAYILSREGFTVDVLTDPPHAAADSEARAARPA